MAKWLRVKDDLGRENIFRVADIELVQYTPPEEGHAGKSKLLYMLRGGAVINITSPEESKLSIDELVFEIFND